MEGDYRRGPRTWWADIRSAVAPGFRLPSFVSAVLTRRSNVKRPLRIPVPSLSHVSCGGIRRINPILGQIIFATVRRPGLMASR
jgi:hypothetical protein